MAIIKPLRLVILGVDGSGKTTLAKELASQFDLYYYKDKVYKEKFFGNADYVWHSAFALMPLIADNEEGFVFDRFFFDEYVYQSLRRKNWRADYWAELIEMSVEQEFRIIHCFKHSRQYRPDEIIDRSNIKLLEEGYENLYVHLGSKIQVEYINTDYDLQSQVMLVRNFISRFKNKTI